MLPLASRGGLAGGGAPVFSALRSGVTVYYRSDPAGTSDLTLTPGPTNDACVTVLGPVAGQVAVPPRPAPTIVIADPRIIVVSYDYHGKKPKPGVKRHRVAIVLGVRDACSVGDGVLTCNRATNDVALFTDETGTAKLTMPLTIPIADLAAGKTVWAEGLNPSNAVLGTEFTLTLKDMNVGPDPKDAKNTLTCVRLRLDIFKARADDDTESVIFERDKRIAPGRYVLEQGATAQTLFAERARLAVAKAEPVDFTGQVLVKPLTADIVFFALTDEKPVDAQWCRPRPT